MKVEFNNKIYEKNKPVKNENENGNGLGRLCYDIFKYYLKNNLYKTYSELQNIFNSPKIHCELSGENSKRKVIFNKTDFSNWYTNFSDNDSKKDGRYFGHGGYSLPIEYNNEELYFTTQWGNSSGNSSGNITKMINFAEQNNFDIKIIDDGFESSSPKSYEIKSKNIILYGAPGIGKTHNYQKLISLIEQNEQSEKEIFDTITDNRSSDKVELDKETFSTVKKGNRVEFITFHQSYSYEDFIEGFRPNKNGNIELKDGIFKNIVANANKEPDKNFYIVIDEINRGNISKIFGELITLIEEDKRGSYEVTLPYSKEPFTIPSNLYIIATMNSTDKSIATIDIALRRRFTFLKMLPNPNLVENPQAKELMEKLNEFIENNIGKDYELGHSYFMKVQNEEDLEFIKEYKIKPLLEEYFYANDEKLNEVLDIFN